VTVLWGFLGGLAGGVLVVVLVGLYIAGRLRPLLAQLQPFLGLVTPKTSNTMTGTTFVVPSATTGNSAGSVPGATEAELQAAGLIAEDK
jgi:hypothetical protein